jgi:hypothetical protein
MKPEFPSRPGPALGASSAAAITMALTAPITTITITDATKPPLPALAWTADGAVRVTRLVDMQRDRHLASGDLRGESAPLSHSSRTSLLVDLPRDEMALLIELVVRLGMN